MLITDLLREDAWDKRKTVRQNYEALGLLASLNPTASGGMERPLELKERSIEASTPEASTLQNCAVEQRNSLPKGYGRIIRDENGNIVDVEMAESDSEENADNNLVEDIPDPTSKEDLAGWVALGSSSSRNTETSGTGVVQKLEELQSTDRPVSRFTSSGEFKTLQMLVAKYGEDVEAMARDRKLNPNQRTASELRRAFRKAGGFLAL
ncbi:unnamed protein product [Somion occarium]|uniref:Nucleolar protein 16 n=1 Tax=Somion occarium TaxID=3059160 RepID=A0ABP1D8Z0_9APHY